MGCSRKHCRECDVLCKLFLGEGYTAHTSAVSQLGSSEQIPLIETVAQEAGVDLTVTIPVQNYQVIFQGAAVRSEREQNSTKYRMSDRLQALIRARSALDLDFSAPRFHNRGHLLTSEGQATAQEENIDIESEYEPAAAVVETPSKEKKRKAISSP